MREKGHVGLSANELGFICLCRVSERYSSPHRLCALGIAFEFAAIWYEVGCARTRQHLRPYWRHLGGGLEEKIINGVLEQTSVVCVKEYWGRGQRVFYSTLQSSLVLHLSIQSARFSIQPHWPGSWFPDGQTRFSTKDSGPV